MSARQNRVARTAADRRFRFEAKPTDRFTEKGNIRKENRRIGDSSLRKIVGSKKNRTTNQYSMGQMRYLWQKEAAGKTFGSANERSQESGVLPFGEGRTEQDRPNKEEIQKEEKAPRVRNRATKRIRGREGGFDGASTGLSPAVQKQKERS